MRKAVENSRLFLYHIKMSVVQYKAKEEKNVPNRKKRKIGR